MPISRSPRTGDILMCDFNPEELELLDGAMDKRRMSIVVTPQHQRSGKMLHVVPISMTAPEVVKPWHLIVPNYCLPRPAVEAKEGTRWAKCDCVFAVGWNRLDRYSTRDRYNHKTLYHSAALDMPTLVAVKIALAAVFGIRRDTFDYAKAAVAADEGSTRLCRRPKRRP
jgi:uncharacterized protein YifN (PemK superfamily)